ncbi:proline--tRNA ligase [Paracoccus saliphilus]|uniref:Proline--tRNA ligase n=1 Tax=Paracoccus saliphilus TaxID=405559 RepID=A0AA45W2D8_9RHOB|nr:proline--tRNA ligase [Paracoccus saliphilus]WCR01971.1 proline--tRNA ligase [Paracoccus saliphilus]SIS65883.1 prolyl-tRNA synthetase [Paracoccus saliphilus]
MRLSRYFLPVLKEDPKEAQIVSHRLMLRAGMIRQQAAGIYSWLPLGYKVLRRIEQIVHEEQQRAGHIPLLMPTLQPADLWRESGRYDDYGEEMLRIRDRHKRDLLYGPTNEEMITDIFRSSNISSYKDLPLTLYHIQWKFRDEIRPRFGVMRGREFLMKDGYNFDLTKEDALHAYNRHLVTYLRSYERMGLQAIPMRADGGPIGGDYTHEFLVLAETGESEVFYDSEITDLTFGDRQIDYDSKEECQAVLEEFTSRYARTDETHDDALFQQVPEARRRVARGIEVGQIFYFGTKYSEPMGATVVTPEGNRVPVHMGSHGIGVSRLLGAIIEASHDDKGIIWPEGVTPFHAGIVNLKQGDSSTDSACNAIYAELQARGLDPLYDDRDERAGAKFARMDLIGLPWRVTVGPRGLANNMVELTNRRTGESEEMSPKDVVARLAAIYAPVLNTAAIDK